ncbi:S8 family peptidase [Gryllotalpicola protaetiae]|uniref:S8 family peptidase n=1 Tax=Gryllotalpicola protaetiae TaxID=2419771 RepID=UPI0013C41656|nr:S8 family serine peptidase [Gryllotalpicola protaetiae]
MAATAVAVSLGMSAPGLAATDAAPTSTGATGAAPSIDPGSAAAKLKLAPELQQTPAAATSTVFVQLAGTGAVDAGSASAAKTRRSDVSKSANVAFAAAKAKDAKATQLYTVSNAVPGFALTGDAAALDAVAARSDVVKITPLTPQTLENASTAQLTKAVGEWQAGNLGKSVKVGIIDTGTDYTHADFGGAGTVAAYGAAKAADSGPWTPTAKVVGGYDFVGDDYDADPQDPSYQPVPHPDTNPLDCNSHGTHVAGIIGGYGVNADGSTFTGDYGALTSDDLYAMKVGPGMAPLASIYSLKVFGCTGSTNVVIPALDWALDPNGDGDFSDHLDIVNLSLGSDYVPTDDPEDTVVDTLAAHGVLPVIAMGNAGDLTNVGGSPGNAVRSVAVASTVDAYQLRDGITVNAPADVAGIADGQFSGAYPWIGSSPVTAPVVASPADDADGCAAYGAADAAAIAGKIVWQYWDDNDSTRACGSAARGANAAAAGAVGAIFTSSLDVFAAGITGDPTIPIIQLPKAQTDRLQPAVDAGTLNVTFDPALQTSVKSVDPAITDTLSSFSSRGTDGSIGVVKPDIAAPGDTIASAGMGSGSGVLVDSGTSMATPNVAGIAALVKLAHPTWTTEQLKADLMNTAGHDVYAGDGQTGPIYGPNRVGAGRVDAQSAVSNDLLVYDKDVPGAVSASFGVITASIAGGPITQKRTLVVQNTGKAVKTVSLSYQAITAEPGVAYRVSPSRLTVGPGRSATATVIVTVTPSALRKTIDPTENPLSGVGVPRSFISDASGRVLIAQPGQTTLRVPVYAAAKPTSATATKVVTTGHGDAASSSLAIAGRGVDQGSGASRFASLASVLTLGATSPKETTCAATQTSGCIGVPSDAVADLRYVGAGSAGGWLYFGVSSWGQGSTIGEVTQPVVDIDTTGDGTPDFEVFATNLTASDVPVAVLIDLHTGAQVDIEPINTEFGDVDTNTFDSDTLLLPVVPAAIGLTPGTTSFPITYQVSTYAYDVPGVVDASPAITYDVADPAIAVGSVLYYDNAGTTVPFQLGSDATATTKALVLHLQGAPGQRAEVVSLSGKHKPTPPGKKHGHGSLSQHRWKWGHPWFGGGHPRG